MPSTQQPSTRLLVGGGHIDVAHEDGVRQRKVVVERLGQVEAQALKQVWLERHCAAAGAGRGIQVGALARNGWAAGAGGATGRDR